jgi:hypothetical protein
VQSMSESTGSSWEFTIRTEQGKSLVAFSFETQGETIVAAGRVENGRRKSRRSLSDLAGMTPSTHPARR